MKYWVILYYLLLLFSGGYRNYSYEYETYATIFGYFNETMFCAIQLLHFSVLFIAATSVLFPQRKSLHLTVFVLLFVLDLYFQNFVKYENSSTLENITPLLIFLIMHLTNPEGKVIIHNLIVGYLCIGYTASALGKIQGGWLSPANLIIQNYHIAFREFMPNPLLANEFIDRYISPTIWKTLDYVAIIFQFSSIAILFSRKYFKFFLLLCTLFHVAVAVIMQVSLFYTYIIFYGIVLAFENGETLNSVSSKKEYFLRVIALVFVIILTGIFHFPVSEGLSLQITLHKDLCLTLLCALLFFYFQAKGFFLHGKKQYEKPVTDNS